MRKKLFLLPLLALGLLFASCGDKTNNNDNNNEGGNTPVAGQALTLNLLNFDQLEGWIGLPLATVEAQLLQMGFTPMEDDEKEEESFMYMKIDYTTMSGYLCGLFADDGNIINVEMIYEAANATSTLGTTVATFKKYAEIQNQTYASREAIYSEGTIFYSDSEEGDGTEWDYGYYDAFVNALNSLTQHNNVSIGWAEMFTDYFAVQTMAGYENGEGQQSMFVGVYVADNSSYYNRLP